MKRLQVKAKAKKHKMVVKMRILKFKEMLKLRVTVAKVIMTLTFQSFKFKKREQTLPIELAREQQNYHQNIKITFYQRNTQ
jgi:hypothetical protein